jgi:hydrogenase expression/formation protein HypC
MCLATPVKIVKITGQKAIVTSGDHEHEVDLSLVPEARVGDYILAHGELAINKLPPEEAEKVLNMICSLDKGDDKREEEHRD